LAIAHGAQFPAQDLLGHRDAIVLENPLCEINQPPAHYPVGGWIGAVLDLLGKGAPVLVLEQGRLARCLAILEALRTLGIEAQHPITDRLQADATDARRIAARAAVKNLGKRQQTTGKGGILALLGEGTKLKSCKIRPKGNRHRHGESPLFAKMNHATADLKTHNESAFQRRGIIPKVCDFSADHALERDAGRRSVRPQNALLTKTRLIGGADGLDAAVRIGRGRIPYQQQARGFLNHGSRSVTPLAVAREYG